MTEQEWLACTDPRLMWDDLWEKGNNRKRQLFACACCRRIWHLLCGQRTVYCYFVELSEQAADGLVTEQQLDDAWPDTTLDQKCWGHENVAVLAATGVSVRWDYESAQQFAAAAATGQPHGDELNPAIPVVAAELKAQAYLVRCIFGNPFRPVSLDPAWLTWHDGLLVSMAQKMYDSRDFADMPVLADAFEEAGCQDQNILAHCRSGGEHARGCWLIDLLLGKE